MTKQIIKTETVEEFIARGGKVQNVKSEGCNARWMKWDEGKSVTRAIDSNDARFKSI